ncbi:MAG: dephospho-CoA kinase [Ruminococcus sp.]|nr:dephospho-CoA kinase [Ruminococcus sp.]
MKKFKLIGLTGQSGAGKSTISATLEQKGALIINADLLVKELYQPGSLCIKVLSSVFGEDIILSDGNLDCKKLASIAFSDKKNTQILNSIVHPFVTDLFLKKIKSTVNQNNSVIVYDAPQLFESGFDVMCDMLVGVVADEKIRVERICSRDNIDKNSALERIKAQYSEDFFRQSCDYIIENNTDLNSLEKAVNKLLEVI